MKLTRILLGLIIGAVMAFGVQTNFKADTLQVVGNNNNRIAYWAFFNYKINMGFAGTGKIRWDDIEDYIQLSDYNYDTDDGNAWLGYIVFNDNPAYYVAPYHIIKEYNGDPANNTWFVSLDEGVKPVNEIPGVPFKAFELESQPTNGDTERQVSGIEKDIIAETQDAVEYFGKGAKVKYYSIRGFGARVNGNGKIAYDKFEIAFQGILYEPGEEEMIFRGYIVFTNGTFIVRQVVDGEEQWVLGKGKVPPQPTKARHEITADIDL